MQLTEPTQTIVHHNEETTHLLSTVWLKEGDILMLEMALFPVDEYTGDVDYGCPVFNYSIHMNAETMPGEAMDYIQSLSHDIMLRAFRESKGQTLEQRGKAMTDAIYQATTRPGQRVAD